MTVRPLYLLFCALAVLLSQTACQPDPPKFIITFHLEGDTQGTDAFRRSHTLAHSGVGILARNEPEFSVLEVRNVRGVTGGEGTYLEVQLTERGKQRLYTASVAQRGRFIFMFVNGQPMAYRKLDRVFSEGILTLWIDLPEQERATFVSDVRSSVEASHEVAERL